MEPANKDIKSINESALLPHSPTHTLTTLQAPTIGTLPILESFNTVNMGNLPKEPPDVALERLCKMHQNSGNHQLCQLCQKVFPNWNKLKQHLNTHADYRPYTCAYCDKTFRNYSKKSRHEKTHSGLKPFVCKICNKHVSRSEHLKRHLLTHTESHPYKCIVCDYRSRRLDCIRYHMKNKHPDKDTKIMFNQKIVDANDDHPNDASDMLWQQYKDSADAVPTLAHPKNKKSKEDGDNSFVDGKMPPYPVTNLDSSFSEDDASQSKYFSPDLRARAHMELPKNMCAVCEKGFDCPSKLRRHQNVHAGIRPYMCHICSKQLSRPEHLKRHLATHEAEKGGKPLPFKSKSSPKSPKNSRTESAASSSAAMNSSSTSESSPRASEDSRSSHAMQKTATKSNDGQSPHKCTLHNNQIKAEVKDEVTNQRTDCQLQKSPSSASAVNSQFQDSPVKVENPNLNHQSQQIAQVVNAAYPSMAAAWNQASMVGPIQGGGPQLPNPGALPMAMMANNAMQPPQFAGANALGSYGPHVAMLHSYRFSSAAQNMASNPAANLNLYNRPTNPAGFSQNMSSNGASCSMPVFPEMR